MDKKGVLCPVCQKHTFAEMGDYDICPICFWENDGYQYDSPQESGANRLSLNDYKKWWQKLNEVVLPLMTKYDVEKSPLASWTFGELIVPRENIRAFVDELTQNEIEIRLSFYNVCEEFGYDKNTFVSYPLCEGESIEEINNECLDIIFCDDPMHICKKYGLKQVYDLLRKNNYKHSFWLSLTPNIAINPNPTKI